MQHRYQGISDVKSTWNDASQYIYIADLKATPFKIWEFCEVKK